MTSGETRQLVAERAEDRCEYCRSPAAYVPDDFAVEHIIPRARGGSDELVNLAWSCQGCNNHKFIATNALDPQTGRTVPLYHPRRHKWRRHFEWSSDGLVLIGKSPTGRATISRLQLNRPSAVNLRRALIAIGEHPP